MRRWHRRIAPWFALLLLIVAMTGIITRVVQSLDHPPHPAKVQMIAGSAPKSCLPDKPVRTRLGSIGHFVKAIHSSESLGPVGVALNLLTGLALCFFAGSGLWMWAQLWLRQRRVPPR